MLICGIKLTHDAGVAVVRDSELLFSVELEKLANNRRYIAVEDLDQVAEILDGEGLAPADIDVFALDGWLEADRKVAQLELLAGGQPVALPTAPYNTGTTDHGAVARYEFFGLDLKGEKYAYTSYPHAIDHLHASYCTSPFARRGEDSLVLVWDAGMAPHLYRFRAADLEVVPLGALFPLAGSAFAYLALQFDPFRPSTIPDDHNERVSVYLEVAGRAMAYAGMGHIHPPAFRHFDRIIDEADPNPRTAAIEVATRIRRHRRQLCPDLTEADIIATYQAYLGDRLLAAVRRKLTEIGAVGVNLCLAGGCALNIKWNSAFRASGLFREIWVPPFPNDSGIALGAACSEMIYSMRTATLSWGVYAGPELVTSAISAGWAASSCDTAGLARILHEEGVPVTLLNGRAEAGPRALGGRSILAAPVRAAMKTTLNSVKQRASYRPVAPICLENRAREIFDPGTPDPYMLYDHVVRPEWVSRIPAVLHIDGTARLQTVTAQQNPTLGRVLEAYERLSGVPVLCNTSANFNGKGFFPDISSAMQWSGTKYIWSDNVLYTRTVDE